MAFYHIGFRQHIRKSKYLRIIIFFNNLLLARLVNRPIVLCFHRIKKSSDNLLDQRVGVTDPDSFEKVINYFRILGYRFISLENLINSISKSRIERVAVVTFDDGFKDLYQNAYPILKKLNIPFTLFLITSTIDSKKLLWLHKLYVAIDELPPMSRVNILRKYINLRDGDEDYRNIVGKIVHSNHKHFLEKLASDMANEANLSKEKERLIAEELYLTKAELLEMKKHGLSIDAHGHQHLPLANLSRTETEKEIRSSVQYIIEELYGKPRFYCLPWGIGNQCVKDVAKNLELIGIATTQPRLVTTFQDAYNLPRVHILNDIAVIYQQLSRWYLEALLEKMHLLRCNLI